MIEPTTKLLDSLETNLARDLLAFLPECILVAGIALGLILKLFAFSRRLHLVDFSLVVSLVALGFAVDQAWHSGDDTRRYLDSSLFTGLLRFDSFALFLRVFLLGFLVLLLWLNRLTGIPDRDDSADYSTLLLGGTLGMMLMVSANHLMMVFIAVEMASLPSYVLSGFFKGRRQGSEAALKYVIYGAAASGVMLYGISLLSARFGSGAFIDLGRGIFAILHVQALDPTLMIGMLFVMVGLAFKLSLVPFHFWVPDVFTGAAAEVGGFLSVASKAAAMGLTTRILVHFSSAGAQSDGTQVGMILGFSLSLFGIATITVGNLTAMGQTNLKRLLGYSTIAHAGYMILGLATLTLSGYSSVLFYLIAYLAMNLGAFAVVALLRNRTGSEEIEAMRGAIQHSPVLVVTFAIFVLSLLGIPPLMGFAAKFQVFAAYYDSAQRTSIELPILKQLLFAILILAGINTVISAGYYLKLLRVMILDTPTEPQPERAKEPFAFQLYAILLAVAVFAGGILWGPIQRWAELAATPLVK
jgi:NADH-quinone oxidoreductase subunit N